MYRRQVLCEVELRLKKYNQLRVVLTKTRSISYGNLAKFGSDSFYDLKPCLVLAVCGRFFAVKEALIIFAGSRDFWYSSLKFKPVSAILNAW